MTSPMAYPYTLPAAPAAHILVVDDVEKNTRLLADLLGAKGYRTTKASSGAQALELIEATAPDLVLLDVMMPGMSGYEVCRTLRADPRHALLPVVMVTALDPAAERANGLDAGADDFLNKPINQAELLARVRSLLRVKTLQDQLLRDHAIQPAAQPAAQAAPVAAQRSEFAVLCVRWPALAGEAGMVEPDALLAQHQSLQDRVVTAAARHQGAVADVHGRGLTVLFNGALLPPSETERVWALAHDLMALSAGLSMGMARGPAVVGSMRCAAGAVEPVAIGDTVQRADQLSREAPANAVLADPNLLAARQR